MAKAPAKTDQEETFKKKEKKNVPLGMVHVQASFNNTIVTFTDQAGNVLAWSSSGSLGFRGSRKGTPFAAQQASLTAANKAKEYGMRTVEVRVSGPGRRPRIGRARAVYRRYRSALRSRIVRRSRTTVAVRPRSAAFDMYSIEVIAKPTIATDALRTLVKQDEGSEP